MKFVARVLLAKFESHRYLVPVANSIGEIIGDNLKRLRNALPGRPSQETLAQRAGVSRSTVARLENHTLASVDVVTLTKLAKALGVSLDELVLKIEEGSLNSAIEEYERSDWKRAQKPTREELLWLRHLPHAQWMGVRPDAKSIADLLEWRRAHPTKK